MRARVGEKRVVYLAWSSHEAKSSAKALWTRRLRVDGIDWRREGIEDFACQYSVV